MRQAKGMLADLARYLLRAVTSRPGEVEVEHIQSGPVDLLFLRVPGHERDALTSRDREALCQVIETIGGQAGRTVIVDWK
ncbi:MAG: hypothetical protein Kow0097_07920 [Candidatus Bipolaricaulota bacterium]